MSVISNPKPTYNGSLILEGQPNVKRGAVMIAGAKATLLSYDDRPEVADKDAALKMAVRGQRSKPQQIDVMRRIKVEQQGETLIIKGESLHALRVRKMKDPTVTVRVDLTGQCKGCG